ncbi:diaminopimelate epimerase [Azorhizobium oxalatiphilum]|uniref:Diaminopimelate epimerase n=1 Tax=Azorhizobium oxalatiphilum TaxID=980631 RepID=A0A917CFV2_9HYPH|nr:diaminopimelate epimerase [Azorhizobium oxalatiphilum]GGF86146.1 diaminopimelate epimerase [Azorhizobium oxalatiphilum]
MSLVRDPTMLAQRPFVKMNGLGNEILVLDLRTDPEEVPAAAARALARPGVLPFDQAMVLYPPRAEGSAAFVRILNSDGSEAGACGNGTRCIAAYEAGRTGERHILFESGAGPLDCVMQPDGRVTVDMGAPHLGWEEIPLARPVADTSAYQIEGFAALGPASFVSVGNPHAIFFVPDVAEVDVDQLGATLERHPLFPERANISFAQVLSPDHILLHVWERGAGRTRACGTAACATAVAAARTGRTGRVVRVTLPGGDLKIDWRESDDHVLMTGPVALEFSGTLTPDMLTEAA